MGLYLHVTINFKGISNEAWENTWLESIEILKKFPLPLSRHDIQTQLGQKRHVYSQQWILKAGEKSEYWRLEGDLLSGQSAETFQFFRHLETYKSDYQTHQGCFKKSVFHTNADELEYAASSNGVELWDSKTQGYPFHLAILAVGILLEQRFPENCYVHGDISAKQVSVMREWLKNVFGKTYPKPICFDANRLFGKLQTVYKNQKTLLTRFAVLYKGGQTEQFKAMLRLSGKEMTYNYYATQLNDFEKLTQWGPQELMRTVLEATKDIHALIEFVEKAVSQRATKKMAFEWTDVLTMLCEDFIFVNPSEREIMQRLTHESNNMQNINDVFGQLFMKMSGMPHISPLYVPANELLEVFALRDPKNGTQYAQIIQESQDKLKNLTKQTSDRFQNIEVELEKNKDFNQEINEKENFIAQYPVHEQYIIRQALQQQDHFGNYEKNIPTLIRSLSGLLQKHTQLYEGKTVEHYLKGIYEYSFHAGFGVSEQGWERIDTLKDLNILKYLYVLATVNQSERTFWRWRKHIFETPETWSYFIQAKKVDSSAN
jgi:hypothetical protein